MPIFWVGFSLQTSPAVDPLKHKPKELEAMVSRLVEQSDPDKKAKLKCLLFQVDKRYACALIKDLDNNVGLKAVMDVLEADYATKFLTADDAAHANEIADRFTPDEASEE